MLSISTYSVLRVGLAHGILRTQFIHLIRVECIEVDAVHEIHEAIGGVLLCHSIDLLKEGYK